MHKGHSIKHQQVQLQAPVMEFPDGLAARCRYIGFGSRCVLPDGHAGDHVHLAGLLDEKLAAPRPAAVLSAFTGYLCCSLADYLAYCGQLLGEPTATLSQLALRERELQQRAAADFLNVRAALDPMEAAVITVHTGTECCSAVTVHLWAERVAGFQFMADELATLQVELREAAAREFRQLAIGWGCESPFVGLRLAGE